MPRAVAERRPQPGKQPDLLCWGIIRSLLDVRGIGTLQLYRTYARCGTSWAHTKTCRGFYFSM